MYGARFDTLIPKLFFTRLCDPELLPGGPGADSATRGNPQAAYWLGLMYWDGRGGPQDKERAKYIWLWAAENNDLMSRIKLQQLNYDQQKGRELATGQAQARQAAGSNSQAKAEEGLAIIFGILLLSALARDQCYDYRKAQLLGIPQSGLIPEKCR